MRWENIVNIAKKYLLVIVNDIPIVCSDFCLSLACRELSLKVVQYSFASC